MSWLSSAISATSKSITSLKSTLLGSEADGDTEDDTHVCRVLRAYYADKGRPLPPWLPPDPKAPAPPPVAQTPSYSSARYGGMSSSQAPNTIGSSGLSSLWDSKSSQYQKQQIPQSLRAGVGRGRQRAPSPFDTGRPNLASQRNYGSSHNPPEPSGSVRTADKLRQRLGRGASGATSTSPANQSAFSPPPGQPSSSGSFPRGGGGNYEDRFAPGSMYGGGGGRTGGNDQSYITANAPWASSEPQAFIGVGGGRPGLPSGPRRGLPGGPRMT